MKKLLAALIVIAIIIGVWFIWMDNQPNEVEEPNDKTVVQEFNIGFDSLTVDSQVIWGLLNQDIAESLRFYNAMIDERGQRSGVILVAVNSDGVELNEPNDMGYIYLDERGTHQSISHEQAIQFAGYVNHDRSISNMISEISKRDMPRGFDEMVLHPDEYRVTADSIYPTVALYAYAYSSERRRTHELETQPCPPLCADRWVYLYDPHGDTNQQEGSDENEGEER
ncbi:MAG: hypothetical protein EA411_04450 [Saprospirales bacterium]|nr:MAG: hypothetical protein EA411_04450 [Saprospirales bacterium]